MSSFTRYAAVAAIVLSLGFLVASAPLTINTNIPTCIGTDAVSHIVTKLAIELRLHIKALIECTTLADVQAVVKLLVASLQICADGLLEVGAGVTVHGDAQASIVTCVATIITVILQVCAQVSIKFGVGAVLAVCAEIDVVLRLLLVNLNICIDGILGLIVKALTSTVVGLLAQLKFGLCLGLFGL